MGAARRAAVGAVTAAVLLIGCGDDGGTEPPAAAPEPDASRVALVDLEPGDCFDGLDLDATTEATTAAQVEPVDCAEPHQHEVFHGFALADDERWPGESELTRLAEEGCAEAFVQQLGATNALSQLSISPTRESWDEGDRTVLCAAHAIDGDPLVGQIS